MFQVMSYITAHHDSKKDCLEELALYLNKEYPKITIVDMEKDFRMDESVACYKPRMYMSVIIMYVDNED